MLVMAAIFNTALEGICPLYQHAMHGVGFRDERPRACSWRRRCRHPLSMLITVSEGLELPNCCNPLLVDVDHAPQSQGLIR
jgi:hypothetical protein